MFIFHQLDYLHVFLILLRNVSKIIQGGVVFKDSTGDVSDVHADFIHVIV